MKITNRLFAKRSIDTIISTETLRAELAACASISAIAIKYGEQRRGLPERIKSLRAADTIVALMHPQHAARAAEQQMHALDLFLAMVDTKRRMLRAYERMAEDPDNPGEYCLNPRADEVTIITEKTVEDGDKLRTVKS
jgi:hypothetical protein